MFKGMGVQAYINYLEDKVRRMQCLETEIKRLRKELKELKCLLEK